MKKEKNDFLNYALNSGRVKPIEEAFEEFPVEEENHKGNAYYIHENEILFKVGKVNIEQIMEYREKFKRYKEN